MLQFDRKNLSDEELIHFFRQLLLPRMIEEKMLILLRQGRISKWFSGIGQEAISVGATLALQQDEWIMPLHRNLGVFTGRGMPLEKLFLQWQGRKDGYSKGRERSFHFGSAEHHVCGMISHLGPQLALADGVALAYALKKEQKISLAFTGDGGTSEGDFHEALNVAAVWDLPVIFIIENNGYGLSTPVNEQYRCENLVDRAKGYGMAGVQIDGNNILTVYDTVKGVRDYCIQNQKPFLIECMTFRMRGHEEASGIKYVPPALIEEWAGKDPVVNFEHYLQKIGILNYEQINEIREEYRLYIDSSIKGGLESGSFEVDAAEELRDVYAVTRKSVDSSQLTVDSQQPKSVFQPSTVNRQPSTEIRFIDAIKEGLLQSMERHDNLILMGQDIAEYGGAFKITEGLLERFGRERVRNTPLCESAILGTALGLSIEGYKSMVEMQFADFVTVGFNQIINNLAKIHYRWGQNADVVIRMPTGAGVGAGPFHSQSNEAWFVHTPGLKVVYPSTPEDAKGLLIAAFNDPNPVLFFEHKGLYRSESGEVSPEYYEIEIGKAKSIIEGSDVSIITYGSGVHWALDYAKLHPELSLDILDLRTLLPLDYAAIRSSVERTGKVLILHEDTLTGGIGGEIAAWISEHCFEKLDAPVLRCASMDTPIPFSIELETQFLAKSSLSNAVNKLISY
jgi:2-oxoisovalerate dehydrogenase E1 component